MPCLTTLLLIPQLKDIGSGNFGVAKLMRYRPTGELVAVKFIERGDKVSRYRTLRCAASQTLKALSTLVLGTCR